MQNAGGMRRGQAIGYTGQHLYHLPPGPFPNSRPTGERSGVDVLGNQKLPAFEFPGVVNSQNVRMIERRGRKRFALESAACCRVSQLIGEELDRDGPVEFR